MKKVVLLALLATTAGFAMAQRNCATTELEQLNKSPELLEKQRDSFEKWLNDNRNNFRKLNALQDLPGTIIYKIPVVVHIIHNGEAYGEGLNITDEQIASQITVLNQDFRHLNADSVNTPTLFQPLMADIGFEFELAKRDPNGLPTDGIVRVLGSKPAWIADSSSDNIELKSLSYWPAEDYLNLWVAAIASPFIGYAEYPTSDSLDGVNDQAVNNRLTDGVVIDYEAFGSVEFYPQGDYLNQFNLGRTATHEIGHFFGLRHIWGDGDCSVDDYVTDTPTAEADYGGCPSMGSSTTTCSSQDMFMNYMDYVDDDCMNLFSLGQKERMVIIVNNSPRRASLLTSPALNPPLPLDAAIADIPSPAIGVCDNLITPTIKIINAGEEQITQIELSITVNEISLGQELYPLSLNASKDTTLIFTSYPLTQYGAQEISATIISTNGRVDDSTVNDTFTKDVFYSEQVSTLNEEFTTWPESWAVRSEAPISNWNYLQAPNLTIENKAAALNYYQNPSAFDDQLITPIMNLSGYSSPYFLFDHAYGERQQITDKLTILVSTDCGNTFTDTLFIKSGDELATTYIPVKFTPSGSIDWHTNILDLSNYNQPVQLAFVGKSAGGNNIYLDNFKLVDDSYEDVGIVGLANESGTYSSFINSIGIIIENSGATSINSLEIEALENDIVIGTQVFDNLYMSPGQQEVLNFNNIFSTGSQNLKFKLMLNDDNPSNNEISTTSNFIDSEEVIPFREKFNASNWNSADKWTITTLYDEQKWASWSEKSGFMSYQAFTKGNIGLHDWLVTPLFDLSQNSLASIQFDIAYASNDENNEVLRLWVSTNGGQSFNNLIKSYIASQMQTATSNDEWSPANTKDWKTVFFDLSDFAGEENVLIGFESIDGDGNNIYLDNIELFVSNEQNIIEIEDNEMAVYPNPVADLDAKITFNLDVKQNIEVRIIDIQGNIISDESFTDVLNQTFPIELSTKMNGIYIIQAVGADFSDISRIIVNK